MADLRKHSSTSNIVRFTLKNSTNGQGLTGVAYNTSGLLISTICDNEATPVSYSATGSIQNIGTLGTYVAPSGGMCRFKEVSSGYHPGLYEFQFLDDRFSVSAAKRMVISTQVTGALNTDYEIQLTQTDLYLAPTIKKNTAVSNFPFYMVQSADHNTPATGLTVTAERSIDGGAFAACTNSPTEVANGNYKINLSASDTNGTIIILKFTATGADPRIMYLITVG